MSPLLLAAADPGAKLVITGLLVLGVVKCGQLAARPRTHAGAAIALGLVLLAALGGQGLAALMKPLEALDPPARMVLSLAGLMLLALLAAAGILTGLLSLVHLARTRGDYDQGARQAVSAVVGGLLLVGLMGFGLREGLRSAGERLPERMLETGPAGAEVRFERLNFRYRAPAEWTRVKADQLNPVATVAYARSRPQIFFMIIAEDAGSLAGTTEGLAEVAKANLSGAAKDVRVVSEAPRALGGLDGVLVESEARAGAHEFHYWNWVHARGGFLYQLVAWTLKGQFDGARTRREVDAALAGFALLDPDGTSAHLQPLADFSSPHGYEVQARGLPWTRLPADDDWPGAELLLQRGPSSFVVITPLSLPGPAPSLQDLTAAWAELTGRDAEGPPFDAPRPWRTGPMEGWTFEFSDRADGLDWAYRVDVLRAPGRAVVCEAWSADPDPGARADALGLIEAATFLHEAAPPSPEALDAPARDLHARALRALGDRAMARSDHDEAAARYRRGCALAPDDGALLQRHLRALSYGDRAPEAIAALDAAPAALRQDRDLLAWSGFLRARAGEDERAATDYAAAFEAGHRDVNDLDDWSDVLWRLDRVDDAVAAVERFLAAGADPMASLLLGRLHRRAGRPEAAVALLEELADAGLSRPVAHALVEAYVDARRGPAALEVCARLQALGLEDAETFALQGRAHVSLERYREARACLEEALRRRHPRAEEVRELLAHVAAALGEGSRASTSTPLEPAPPPAGWTEVAPLPPGAREAGACYLTRLQAVRYRRGAERTTTDYLRVAVLDQAQAAEFNAFVFEFDPLREAMFVNSLRVLEGGEVVATGDLASQYVLDDTSDGAPGTQKRLHVPVPGVTAGRTIEVVVTRRALRAPDEFGFLRRCLSLGYPVGLSGLEVTGDTAALRAVGLHGATVERADGALRCVARAPQVYRWEPLGAHYLTYLPTVVVGDEARTWEQVGRDYLAMIEAPLAPADAAGALARTTVERVAAPGRAAALAAAVQRRLTYHAVAFGHRALVPRAVDEILGTAYGDCKDHALLLHQLLHAQGIASALALVSVGDPVEARVPSLEQFDHMVVVLTGEGGDRFVDPTDKSYALGEGVPLGLGGGQALVLTDPPRLVRVPDYPAGSSSLVVSRTVTPAGDLDLAVTERLRLEGFAAAWLRMELASQPEAEHLQWAQRELARLAPGARVTAATISGLKDVAAPVQVDLRYTLAGALQRAEGRRVGRLPAGWETRYLAAQEHAARTTPFAVQYPMSVQSTTRLRGVEVRPEGQGGESPGPFVSWRVRVAAPADAAADEGVTVTFAARRAAFASQPATRYAAFVEASRGALDAVRLPFSCR